MDYEAAVSPLHAPTELVWSFAFAESQLLLAEDEDVLAPGPPLDAEVRHYLGRLDGQGYVHVGR